MSLADTVAHLSPERWEQANRLLIRKALAEFAHERLITPEEDGDGYVVRSDDKLTAYRFTAVRRALDHWQVDAASISRHRDGAELPLAALDFFIEFKDALGLTDEILPVYLEEISSTLSGTCYKLTKPQVPSAELAGQRLPGDRDGDDRGPPLLRRQQRAARLRHPRVPVVRPGDREPDPPGLAGRAPLARRLHGRGRHRLRGLLPPGAGRGDRRPLRT
ncbi:hypothetical protein SGLAM104S_09642 [Streptomyces glaucescens]